MLAEIVRMVPRSMIIKTYGESRVTTHMELISLSWPAYIEITEIVSADCQCVES